MKFRQMLQRCVSGVLLLATAGCTDPMLGLDRPSAEPTLSLATQPALPRRPASRPASASTSRPASQAGQPVPTGDIFMLYLVRDPGAVPTGPYAKAVTLKRVEPSKAVWLVDWLTEPSGQGGSGDRQFLVYGDATVLDWACDVAAMLDVRIPSTQAAKAPRQPVDAFGQAVTSLYTAASATEISRQTAESVVISLEGYCSKPGDPHRRWVACMVTGRLLEDTLGNRKEAAVYYDRAARLVQPGSPAWLVSRYRQASTLYSSGRKAEARTIAQDVISHAKDYSRTRAYRQAERLLAGGGK